MNKRSLILSIALPLLLLIQSRVMAQDMLGTTGGLNIPTAEMQPSGTFMGGINFVGKGIIQGEMTDRSDDCWRFEYNTGIYYLNFTPFSWLEVTLRETMLRSKYSKHNEYLGEYKYRRSDRSMSFRVRPLKEGLLWPAIVIGTNDPWKDTGHNIYCSAYAVASKHIHLKSLASTWLVTLGYAKSFNSATTYDGLIAGLKYTPDFFKEGSVLVEYDTQGFNVGLHARLWHHLGLYAFTREFTNFNCGIRYEYTIKY